MKKGSWSKVKDQMNKVKPKKYSDERSALINSETSLNSAYSANNNQSDDSKYVRIQIYDPSTQVSDTLRIRLLPQVFYHYTITASKEVGQNQHIWSIVDPNYEKSVTPRDSIIQALKITQKFYLLKSI